MTKITVDRQVRFGGRRLAFIAGPCALKTVFTILVLLPAAACAFDSRAWFDKRAAMDREAARLRAAYADCAARADAPAENVTLPIESHPDGSIKSTITAKKAQFFIQSGLVWGADVVVRQFATNGVVEAEVAAENCVVDRTAKSGWANGRARARYRGSEVEGDGIHFSFSEEFVTIYSNTVIRTKEIKFDAKELTGSDALKSARGGASATNRADAAEIAATRTDFDRTAGVVLFEGGVRAADARYELGADRIFLFLDGTNSLRRVVADGSVTIRDGIRSGACARASYVKPVGRVDMYGDGASTRARLVEDGARRNEIEGKKITFWVDSDQIEIVGSALTIDGGLAGGQDVLLGGLAE